MALSFFPIRFLSCTLNSLLRQRLGTALLMASQKLVICCAAAIASLLRCT
jgi:hypothetical protein